MLVMYFQHFQIIEDTLKDSYAKPDPQPYSRQIQKFASYAFIRVCIGRKYYNALVNAYEH